MPNKLKARHLSSAKTDIIIETNGKLSKSVVCLNFIDRCQAGGNRFHNNYKERNNKLVMMIN